MSQRHWLADAQVTHCALCKAQFTSVVRKHHCRLCGDIFCEPCSSRTITVKELSLVNQRGCISCHDYVNKFRPFLQLEKRFTRYISGDKYDCWVSLSENEATLTVRDESKKRPQLRLAAPKYVQVLDGFKTQIWRDASEGSCSCLFGQPEVASEEHLCFSVCFSNETVDLRADSVVAKNQWVEAWNGWARLRQPRIAEFVDEEKARYEHQQAAQLQKERSEKTRLITEKYGGKRDEFNKKYGSERK